MILGQMPVLPHTDEENQIWTIDDQILHIKEIQIDDPWSPFDLTDPAHF